MKTEQLMNEIREANLSYLMLAQTMIREDRDTAIYRLGVNEAVANIIEKLSPAQLVRMAVGSTVAACQDSYLQMLAADGTLSDEQAEASGVQQRVEGKIATIAQAVIDGNSHFYVTLEGSSDIYDFALPDLLAIVRYRVGDQIAFTCTAEETPTADGSQEDEDATAVAEDAGAALVRPVTAIEQ